MTEPINPYSTLQMTLEVERLQHIKHMEALQDQGTLAQQMEKKKEMEQRKINSNEKAEQKKVKDDESNNNSQGKEQKRDSNDNEEDNGDKFKKDRGNIIDVKI